MQPAAGASPPAHSAVHVCCLTSSYRARRYTSVSLTEGSPMVLEIALKGLALASGFGLAFAVSPLLPF